MSSNFSNLVKIYQGWNTLPEHLTLIADALPLELLGRQPSIISTQFILDCLLLKIIFIIIKFVSKVFFY